MKYLISLALIGLVAFGAIAADYTPVSEEDSVVLTNDLTIDGKYAAVGSDATTGLMIQTGTCTNGQTVTFSPVFGGTPIVVGNYTVDAGADTVIEFTSTDATNTTCAAAAAKVINWVAIGARP